MDNEYEGFSFIVCLTIVTSKLRRCPQQHGVRSVFNSDTTLRSQLVQPKDPVDPRKQDGVVYKIPCECGKV